MEAEHYSAEHIRDWMRQGRPLSAIVIHSEKFGHSWDKPIGPAVYLYLGSPQDWVECDERELPMTLFELANRFAFDVGARPATAEEIALIRPWLRSRKSWAKHRQARYLARVALDMAKHYTTRSGLAKEPDSTGRYATLAAWHAARSERLARRACLPD